MVPVIGSDHQVTAETSGVGPNTSDLATVHEPGMVGYQIYNVSSSGYIDVTQMDPVGISDGGRVTGMYHDVVSMHAFTYGRCGPRRVEPIRAGVPTSCRAGLVDQPSPSESHEQRIVIRQHEVADQPCSSANHCRMRRQVVDADNSSSNPIGHCRGSGWSGGPSTEQ